MPKHESKFCSLREVCKNDTGECESPQGCNDFERK